MTQRNKRCELDSDRISRLESLGFVWDAHDRQWEKMFAKLKQYHRKQGDCLVPRHYKEDPSLGFWVNTLRNRRDELHSERIAGLDSIGFVWDSHDHQWEGMFAKLAEYHQCQAKRGRRVSAVKNRKSELNHNR